MKKKLAVAAASVAVVAAVVAGCAHASDRVSKNLSTAADNYEIYRRIVAINGITDQYLLQVEGRCALGNDDPEYRLSFTCKIGEDRYIKDFVLISDNTIVTVEQLEPVTADPFHFRVVFRPENIIPDVDLQTSGD